MATDIQNKILKCQSCKDVNTAVADKGQVRVPCVAHFRSSYVLESKEPTPLLCRCFTKLSLCVVFPHRSPPSNSMNAPRSGLVDVVPPAIMLLVCMQALKQWQWPALREPHHCLTAAATAPCS